MVKFCSNCRKILPIIEKKCPFCGNSSLLRYCKNCKKIIPDGVTSCSSCGDIDPTVSKKDKTTQISNKTESNNITGYISLALIAFPIIMLICALMLPSPSSLYEDSNGRNKSWALVVAEDYVKDNLKAPSTAKFSWSNETTVYISKMTDVWEVSGWVDAQNGFGAMIRSNYTVKFKSLAEEEWAYTPISCSIK